MIDGKPGTMSRDYWDTVAADYDGSVLSVFDHDVENGIQRRVDELADRGARAADLGCGVGKFTPMLSACFGHVEACDLSPRCLERARVRCQGVGNVRFHQFDFTSEPAPFEPVAFAFCVNVLLMPSLDDRMRAWRLVANQVAQGGHLLLVVPAHESILFQSYLAVSDGLNAGLGCEQAVEEAVVGAGSAREKQLGVHALDGRPTKHYLADELRALLCEHHFDVLELAKFEYELTNDGGVVDRFWDWLAVGRRR